MHVQIVNFNLKDMTDAEFRSMANEVAPAFASVPGLIGKIWLADAGKDTYGGVYIWQDAAAMQAYLASDLGQGVTGNPNFANLTSRDLTIVRIDGLSRVDRTPVTSPTPRSAGRFNCRRGRTRYTSLRPARSRRSSSGSKRLAAWSSKHPMKSAVDGLRPWPIRMVTTFTW
jgi:heme-degrading monooxygenase HmoA